MELKIDIKVRQSYYFDNLTKKNNLNLIKRILL